MVSLTRSSALAGKLALTSAAAASANATRRACVIFSSHRPARRPACLVTPGRASIAASLLFLLGAAQHSGGCDCRIAGLDPDIDHGHRAVLDRGDRLLEGCHQIGGLLDRAEALRALRARQSRQIDVGLRDALADPAVLHRPRADAGDPLLVQLVIEE